MNFFNQGYGDYEPTSIDDEIFLTKASVKLLMQSIQNQFDDPEEYRKRDYIKSFLTKYTVHQKYLEDEDEADTLTERYDKFTLFVRNMFERYLNVSIVNFEDLPETSKYGQSDNQHDVLHFTYRFFLNDIKKNFINVIINYINKNRELLGNTLTRKNDVTYNNFKSEISDEVDLLVLSNLSEVAAQALSNIKDVDDFFELCIGPKYNLELEKVKGWYERFVLTGNFVQDYVDMLTPDFIDSIESKVRNKILDKYPFRKNADIEDMNAEMNKVDIDDVGGE